MELGVFVFDHAGFLESLYPYVLVSQAVRAWRRGGRETRDNTVR
jgi:hypothetical protein